MDSNPSRKIRVKNQESMKLKILSMILDFL